MIHPSYVAVWYTAISLLTFVVYAIDKRAARKNRWRIPEAQLHLLALLGGWPGAIIAQQVLRHKSVKPLFRIIFWISVGLNIAFVYWLLLHGEGES